MWFLAFWHCITGNFQRAWCRGKVLWDWSQENIYKEIEILEVNLKNTYLVMKSFPPLGEIAFPDRTRGRGIAEALTEDGGHWSHFQYVIIKFTTVRCECKIHLFLNFAFNRKSSSTPISQMKLLKSGAISEWKKK